MYAVIQIPLFPLQALLRSMRQQPKGPMAVLDESGEQSYVLCVNEEAARYEVKEGMRPAKALARCPILKVLVRQTTSEEQAERVLLLSANTLSPRIERTDQGIVTINLKGAKKPELQHRCEKLVDQLKLKGLHACIGIAGTPDHAFWAAIQTDSVMQVHSIDSFLKQLPLETLRTNYEVVSILEGWGIHDLSRFKELPREELGARLGQKGLDLWDAVSGQRVRPLMPFQSQPKFHRKLELDYRVESLDALLFILKRFVDELALELRFFQKAAFIFQLHLQLENKQVQRETIEVPVPSSRATTLFRILETALESFRSEGPIIGIFLRLETTDAQLRQGDLFAVCMEDVVGFAETADRIAALVGPNRSGSPRLNNTWRPDSFRLEKLDTELAPERESTSEEPLINLPLNRYRPPRRIHVFLQESLPVSLESNQLKGIVKSVGGPWTSSSDWWDQKPWSREEWDVELEQGGLYRIFRSSQGWFVEGCYG